MAPPDDYKPVRTPHRRLMATPTPMNQSKQEGLVLWGVQALTVAVGLDRADFFQIPEEQANQIMDVPPTPEDLPFTKADDYKVCGLLILAQISACECLRWGASRCRTLVPCWRRRTRMR